MATTSSFRVDDNPTAELTSTLAQTATALFTGGTVEDTLQRTVDLAVETIEGCDFAGIFTRVGNRINTPVHTHPVVIEVDNVQHRLGEGPCLDAMSRTTTVYAQDLVKDIRWPRLGRQAKSIGVRCALALALPVDVTSGALNLYAAYPEAFGIIDRGRAAVLAILGGIALSTAESRGEEERRTANLQVALVSREVIGQAQGILMERERITANQAFDILNRASQHLNVKLRDVAQVLVDTGERPETGCL